MRPEGRRLTVARGKEDVKKSRQRKGREDRKEEPFEKMLCALCDLCVQRDSFTSSKAVALHGCRFGFARHPQLAANPFLNRLIDVRVLFQELLGVLATLAEPFAAVREPRARLFDDPFVDGQIEQVAGARDAFAVHDVELRFPERRRDLVLHDFAAMAATDDGVDALVARYSVTDHSN